MTVDRALGQAILVEIELRPEVVTAIAHDDQLTLDGSRTLDAVETYTVLDRLVRLEVEVVNGPPASITPPEHGAVVTAPGPRVAVTTVSSQVFENDAALFSSSRSGDSQGS
ncbi:MAG: hypothetical protein IH956_07550 [Chloroflexi bacterium]|nr:hypothetical protein [Chloroflexota bacterium]